MQSWAWNSMKTINKMKGLKPNGKRKQSNPRVMCFFSTSAQHNPPLKESTSKRVASLCGETWSINCQLEIFQWCSIPESGYAMIYRLMAIENGLFSCLRLRRFPASCVFSASRWYSWCVRRKVIKSDEWKWNWLQKTSRISHSEEWKQQKMCRTAFDSNFTPSLPSPSPSRQQ